MSTQVATLPKQDAVEPALLPPVEAAAAGASLTIVELPSVTKHDKEEEPAQIEATKDQPEDTTVTERRIAELDRSFYVSRRNGLIAAAVSLWIAIGVMAVGFAAAEASGFSSQVAGASAVAAGVGIYAFFNVVLGLLMNHALERKITEIRRTARIGCERMRVDDTDLMRTAIRDVLSEWMHINFFARHLRESSAIVAWVFGVQGLVTAAAITAWALAAPASPMSLFALVIAPLALTIAHTIIHVRMLRRQVREVAPKDQDPTEVLGDRMISLLEEVKDLRKPARRG